MTVLQSLSDEDLTGVIKRAANPALCELIRRGYEIELTIKPGAAGQVQCPAPLKIELRKHQDRKV